MQFPLDFMDVTGARPVDLSDKTITTTPSIFVSKDTSSSHLRSASATASGDSFHKFTLIVIGTPSAHLTVTQLKGHPALLPQKYYGLAKMSHQPPRTPKQHQTSLF